MHPTGSIPGWRNSKCSESEAGVCLAYLRNSKEAGMAAAESRREEESSRRWSQEGNRARTHRACRSLETRSEPLESFVQRSSIICLRFSWDWSSYGVENRLTGTEAKVRRQVKNPLKQSRWDRPGCLEVVGFCIDIESRAAEFSDGLEVRCARKKELKVDSRRLGWAVRRPELQFTKMGKTTGGDGVGIGYVGISV